jgi:hypothetical protein
MAAVQREIGRPRVTDIRFDPTRQTLYSASLMNCCQERVRYAAAWLSAAPTG